MQPPMFSGNLPKSMRNSAILNSQKTYRKKDGSYIRIGQERSFLTSLTIDLDGKPISLQQYRGKVILLDFWAVWCHGPCIVRDAECEKGLRYL